MYFYSVKIIDFLAKIFYNIFKGEKMICRECPYGTMIQTDSLIWMIQCPIEDALMALEDECDFPDTTIGKEFNYGKNN